MTLIDVIEIKNNFHVLIYKAMEKAKTNSQFKSIKILKETLETLNFMHEAIEEQNKKIKDLRKESSNLYYKNALLKNKINKLEKQLKF